jgi:sugar lactone lactonase YvrE
MGIRGMAYTIFAVVAIQIYGAGIRVCNAQAKPESRVSCWYDERGNFTSMSPTSDGTFVGGPVQRALSGPRSFAFYMPALDLHMGATCPKPSVGPMRKTFQFTIQTLVAPGPSSPISSPESLASTQNAAIYFIDSGRNALMKFQSGETSVVVGFGSPHNANGQQLQVPLGMALGNDGSVYIADTRNNLVRKVGADGNVVTVAGTGKAGYSGDGGLATKASLNWPEDVAVDRVGNLYIGDGGNHRVRKVDAKGQITTFAGNGGAPWGPPQGDGGPAINAALHSPEGLTLDSGGNLYIADSGNHCVRKVDVNGKISTIAGNGNPAFSGDGGPAREAELSSPMGVAVDTQGNVYIADTANQRLRGINTSGVIETIAGTGQRGYAGDGGPATSAQLWGPHRITVAPWGPIFFSDTGNARIRYLPH